MSCFFPRKAWYAQAVNPETGKHSVVFTPPSGKVTEEGFTIPCGQCQGCLKARARQWAMRCIHEASLYDKNCFVTLTYDEEHLPGDGSVCVGDFQKFVKRLRKRFGSGMRYFHCGEYGTNFGRPHYHACLFNFDFPDKELLTVRLGNNVYRSGELERLWPFGFSMIGEVTFESAAYVARYCTKKVYGVEAAGHYRGKKPEYTTMSRRPGIGRGWYDKFKKETYRDDFVVLPNGVRVKPAKAYDKWYEMDAPEEYEALRERRREEGEARVVKDAGPCPARQFDRRMAMMRVDKARGDKLERSYEDGNESI